MHILKIITLFFLLFCLQANAQKYWQQKVDHDIEVRLHPSDHSIYGKSKITYTNNSPDTLTYIWFHLWPNAYKNEQTAFAKQLLENGDTRFHFSKAYQKGYIDQIEFSINGIIAQIEKHPHHIDIIKLILPTPLLPGKNLVITTPFHVQLPFNFSRGGWNGSSYQVTQWFPKPAVYDSAGWHPMPYLDQGEFYSDFGTYHVSITVPYTFTVAATGIPQQPVEQAFYIPEKNNQKGVIRWDEMRTKTLQFNQTNIHDFAWFADPTLSLYQDTILLPSGKIINAQVYYHLDKIDLWQNSLQNVKDAIHTLSHWIGDYPYDHVTVLDGEQGFTGGMEYPTITILTGVKDQKALDLTIFHEVGHNWFYGALASNERGSPWMDEGMNTYYEKRYEALKYPYTPLKGLFGLLYDPRFSELSLKQQIQTKKDQPITTAADKFTSSNYNLIAYNKASLWMKQLASLLGQERFDRSMQTYFATWKFKHPTPNAFKQIVAQTTDRNLDSLFSLLTQKGSLMPEPKKPLTLLTHFQLDKIYTKQPIFINPAAAINSFNGLMAGLVIHNLTMPMPRFTMVLAPLYGFKSHALNGWSRLGYTWYPDNYFQSIELSSVNSNLHTQYFVDSTGRKYGREFIKVAPHLKMLFKESDPRSSLQKILEFRYADIHESQQFYDQATASLVRKRSKYGVFQTKFTIENNRVLHPWKAEWSGESHKDFYRVAFLGKYFINYILKGGIQFRYFVGKFFYKGNPTSSDKLNLQRYYLQMTGPKGNEDYNYNNPYFARFAYEGFSNQQIMERDGNFKIRTDQLSPKLGVSDNWLSAVNMEMDIPKRFNPLRIIPLKIFMDLGTNGNFWKATSSQSLFLYDGGFQISFLQNMINFYFPIIYSNPYREYINATPGNTFFKRMSFSINVGNFDLKKLTSSF